MITEKTQAVSGEVGNKLIKQRLPFFSGVMSHASNYIALAYRESRHTWKSMLEIYLGRARDVQDSSLLKRDHEPQLGREAEVILT